MGDYLGGSASENSRKSKLDRHLAMLPMTDLGNAERFAARYRDKLMWCPSAGWSWWDGQSWRRDGAHLRVKLAIHAVVRAIQDEAATIVDSDFDGYGVTDRIALKNWGRRSECNSRMNAIAELAKPYLMRLHGGDCKPA